MTLSELLKERNTRVVTDWLRRLTAQSPEAGLSRQELIGAIPQLLAVLADCVAPGAITVPPEKLPDALETLAASHAEQRFSQKVPADFLYRENDVLRESLLVAIESSGVSLPHDHLYVLSRLLDLITLASTRHHAALRDSGGASQRGAAAAQPAAERDLEVISRAEAALRESEERYRLMVESVRDYGVFMISVEGRVSGWNHGAEKLKGYSAEEIIGAPLSTFFTRDAVEEHVPERLLARAALEGNAQYEGWIVRKDGKRLWSVLTIDAVKDEDGKLLGFSNVARDQTQRRQAQLAQEFLSEAGQLLAGSLDYATTLRELARFGTRSLAEWCVIHIANSRLLTPAASSHVDPEKAVLLERSLQPILETRADRGPLWALRNATADLCSDTHEELWVRSCLGLDSPRSLRELGGRTFISVPLTARGQTFGVYTVVSGRSQHSYSQADVRYVEELARRGALALDNARLYRKAGDAVRARDEFISIASHDLRTPLSVLQVQLQKLLRAARGPEEQPSREELVAQVGRMGKQADRMLNLMDTLMDVTRITAGRLDLTPRKTDLGALVQECVDRLSDGAVPAGSEIRVTASGPVIGMWDATRIEQVVTNLLTNALKFGAGKPIDVLVDADGGVARLTVEDRGIGIAEEDVPHLFERFERAPGSREVDGFGVGLWIVRRILDAHGGRISVESIPNQGTRFVVDLPLLLHGDAPQIEPALSH